jgi:glycerate dehydrogenase
MLKTKAFMLKKYQLKNISLLTKAHSYAKIRKNIQGQLMNIVILDYKTLGEDLDLSGLNKYGNVIKYPTTNQLEAVERVKNADIIVVNKVKITKEVIDSAQNLKLICETATGYDNIDISYCKKLGIKVTNTPAYSANSVAQVTISMACSLMTHLNEYQSFVHSGKYQTS